MVYRHVPTTFRSLIFVISVVLAISSAILACGPTDPGRIPTTTPRPCCRTNIFDEGASTGRGLFNPTLQGCPDSATFICSVMVDLSMNPTSVVANGNTVIGMTANGQNTEVTLQCRKSDRVWLFNAVTIDTIKCLNDPAPG